ncbi:chemotaxis protein [Desulfocarbo indianensis]|nr:chemotaxis protein [Desulfocarbo indianensis]
MEQSLPMHGELEFFITELSAEHATSRMPVKAGMCNPFGTVHAGAMLWMADVTATVLALGKTQASPGQKGFPLAVNLHCSLLGNVGSGEIRAEARYVRRGRRVSVIRTLVTADGKLLAEVTTSHLPA